MRGKAYLTFVSIIAGLMVWLSPCAPIAVRMIDSAGTSVDVVRAGIPFYVEIAYADTHHPTTEPTIANSARYHGQRTGLFVTTINGKTTIKYTYMLMIDEPGTHVVGPITVYTSQGTVDSDVITIRVVEHDTSHALRTTSQPFLELTVDKSTVVVGEYGTATLRFVYTDESTYIHAVGEPSSLPALHIDMITGPDTGSYVHDGITYHYLTWTWRWYATEEGKLVIPMYRVDFAVKNQSHGHMSFPFFINFATPTRVYSNGVTINVVPLPPYFKPVDAVGDFSRIDAQLRTSRVVEGEGALYTLTITGNGAFERMHAPELAGLDAHLKWYHSQEKITVLPDGTRSKEFEYVLQPLIADDHRVTPYMYDIPPQEYTFFNTTTAQYVPLITEPCQLVVVPRPEVAATAMPLASQLPSIVTATSDRKDDDVVSMTTMSPDMPRPLPLLWCILIMVMPLGMMGLYRLRYRFPAQYQRMVQYICYHSAYVQARIQLQKAAYYNNTAALRSIFVQLFAYRDRQEIATITYTYMRNHSVDGDQKRWHVFVDRLYAYAFNAFCAADEVEIWPEARQWIEQIGKRKGLR